MSDRSTASLWKQGVKWGIVLGFAVVVWTTILHGLGFYTTRIALGLIADNVAVILPMSAVTAALIAHRRQNGSLTILQAIAAGLVVGIVSAPISVGFLWIYHHWINPAWVDYLVEFTRNDGLAQGISDAQIGEKISRLRQSATDRAQITAGVVGSIALCTVAGLIGGLILRRRVAALENQKPQQP